MAPGSVSGSEPGGGYKLFGLGDGLLCFNPDCISNTHCVTFGKSLNISQPISSSVTCRLLWYFYGGGGGGLRILR